MNNNVEVADRIKSCAKSRGITQAHLCAMIGKRRTFISEVAAGKDSIDENEIDTIANELGEVRIISLVLPPILPPPATRMSCPPKKKKCSSFTGACPRRSRSCSRKSLSR